SRNGLTLSPNMSLSAFTERNNRKTSFGIGASTSYSSRSGIKALQLYEQMSHSYSLAKGSVKINDKGDRLGLYSNRGSSISATLHSSSISFTKPSYVPTMRMPLTNSTIAGHVQIGSGMYCGFVSGEVEVYGQKSEVADEDTMQKKPMFG